MLYAAFGMSRYILLLWGQPHNNKMYRDIPNAAYSIRTLLKMDHWSPKHVELLNVMNKINHQILCILLDYRYIRSSTLFHITKNTSRMRGDIWKEHCYHILYDLLQHPDVGYTPADVIRQEETTNIFRQGSGKHFWAFGPQVAKPSLWA